MKLHDIYIDPFTAAYLEAMLWSTHDESTPEGGEPMDANYDFGDLSYELVSASMADCAKFQHDNADDLADLDTEYSGHDFWLTRCGHGAGFWDRGYGEVGKRLTDAAHKFGELSPYIGDDGKVYL